MQYEHLWVSPSNTFKMIKPTYPCILHWLFLANYQEFSGKADGTRILRSFRKRMQIQFLNIISWMKFSKKAGSNSITFIYFSLYNNRFYHRAICKIETRNVEKTKYQYQIITYQGMILVFLKFSATNFAIIIISL